MENTDNRDENDGLNRASHKPKWFDALAAALLVGTGANAVWEYFARPALSYSGRVVLEISTFGLQRMKDVVYQAAASQRDDLVASQSYFAILVFGVLLFGSMLSFSISIERGEFRIPKKKPSREREKQIRRKHFLIAALLAPLILGGFMKYYRTVYVDYVRAYYFQCESIVAPFLTPDERLEVRSKFAQVQSREDYIVLINRLKLMGTKNKTTLPEAELW